jgi:hypothetical protein
MLDRPMAAEMAYQIVHDELMLDGNAHLNLATFEQGSRGHVPGRFEAFAGAPGEATVSNARRILPELFPLTEARSRGSSPTVPFQRK